MKQLFYGGVHPAEHKEATEQKPIQPLAKAPAQVVIPMSMHIGAPCKPTVQKGDTVLVGQMIGATGLLLGIALAMYRRVDADKRAKYKSMFISTVLAVFLTGVTEPLEFMFMFCAMPLYVVYAILQGCAFAMAGIIHLRLHSFGNLEFITRIPMSLQAGLGVAKKVNMLAHSIVRGMSQGVLPLIGYNYASGDHKRMKASITLSMALSIAMAALCMTVSLVFSRQLIGLFIPGGSESVAYGAAFLRILCLGGPFSACAYALISFFQAVGRGMRSFVLAILRKGLLDIPLMFLLNRLLPIFGVVWATPITDVICCCISIAMFVAFLRGQEGLLDDKPATAEPVRRRWMKLAHS